MAQPNTKEAVILAGGLGKRLRSVVSDVPKPLAPVCGRPFLAWLLDRFAQQGLRRVCLATGYMAEHLEATLGRRWQGMELIYSVEAEPLGTGGALLQALTHLQGDSVHVCNGDTWLLYSLHGIELQVRRHSAIAAVALANVADTGRYGAVSVAGERIVAFQEKGGAGPGFINAGSYFLTAAALAQLSRGNRRGPFSLEAEFLYPLAGQGRLVGFGETTGFIDIGVPEDYALAQKRFEPPALK